MFKDEIISTISYRGLSYVIVFSWIRSTMLSRIPLLE